MHNSTSQWDNVSFCLLTSLVVTKHFLMVDEGYHSKWQKNHSKLASMAPCLSNVGNDYIYGGSHSAGIAAHSY